MNLYIKHLVISMRPHQWTKNLFIFAGVIFSGNLFDVSKTFKSFLGFVVFCGLSGAIYIINDIKDIDQDRQHPMKSKRPLASGKLRISNALPVAIILLGVCLGFSFYLNVMFGVTALSYGLLHIAYSLILKHIVIIDIFSVSLGFVLRVVAGDAIISEALTPWILICMCLLALFISLGKRRGEVVLLKAGANEHRQILEKYTLQYLDYLTLVVATSTPMISTSYIFVVFFSWLFFKEEVPLTRLIGVLVVCLGVILIAKGAH